MCRAYSLQFKADGFEGEFSACVSNFTAASSRPQAGARVTLKS